MTADPRRKLDVPPEWGAAASEIFERGLRTVLVIGGSAVGKSSFCRYLTEVLLAREAEVAFVDADIGQSNIGPPATVTLGYPVAPINFPTVPPAAYYFVGSTGPIRRFLPHPCPRGTGWVRYYRYYRVSSRVWPHPKELQDRRRATRRRCCSRKTE